MIGQHQGQVLAWISTDDMPASYDSAILLDSDHIRAVDNMLDGCDQTRSHKKPSADISPATRVRFDSDYSTPNATYDVS